MNAPIWLYMSMSLDGFIAGPDDRPGQELGQGGGRLFNWLDDRMSPGINGQVYGEALATGAATTTTAYPSTCQPITSTRAMSHRAARCSPPMSASAPHRWW